MFLASIGSGLANVFCPTIFSWFIVSEAMEMTEKLETEALTTMREEEEGCNMDDDADLLSWELDLHNDDIGSRRRKLLSSAGNKSSCRAVVRQSDRWR